MTTFFCHISIRLDSYLWISVAEFISVYFQMHSNGMYFHSQRQIVAYGTFALDSDCVRQCQCSRLAMLFLINDPKFVWQMPEQCIYKNQFHFGLTVASFFPSLLYCSRISIDIFILSVYTQLVWTVIHSDNHRRYSRQLGTDHRRIQLGWLFNRFHSKIWFRLIQIQFDAT